MSLVKGSLIGIGGAGVLGVGGYLVFRSQQPTDVKSRLVWDGLSIVESQSLGVYKALYLANHTKTGFTSFVTSSTKEDAAPLLKAKCNKLFSVNTSSKEYEKSLEEAKKWCLLPEKTTIEISLLLEDANFSSSDDDYKNIFASNKSNQSFIDAIKSGDSSLSTSSSVDVGLPKLKAWCTSIITKAPKEEDLKNARAWCLKGPLDIKEQLSKEGLVSLKEGQWTQGFTRHKGDQDFLKAIEATSPPSIEDSTGGTKLQTWCTEKLKMKLHDNSYSDTYNKVKKYCTSN
ncbi:hypothetical protein MHC_03860 [Mycoplasma haemocanis str. Illinois]|uniref:Uncharacterized protein n=1 Tax=Mycoplasma haemocanis (strain Illinois) TaxID=1111676 RepID=H6N7L0_MYCHN|nr:hypothetical protein [Mycoplasma haemocanis]AEW45632.1 hypothetical protein MHC_03860 [Mycoplasma haemocanis str. Illinois]